MRETLSHPKLRRVLNRIDVALTPGEASLLPPADAYVVIDALRATTTIAVLFHRGLRGLRVVSNIEAARTERREGLLLFGEEGGLRPEGFDFGNSPAEAATLDLVGRDAVQVTSNGTVALCSVARLGATAAGALVNLSAVAEWAERFETVTFVCAGNARASAFSLEDFAVAAAFVQTLAGGFPRPGLGDAARLAFTLEQPDALIAQSEHAEVTRGLGFANDIAFATRRDVAPSVPVVTAFGEGWAQLEAARPQG